MPSRRNSRKLKGLPREQKMENPRKILALNQ